MRSTFDDIRMAFKSKKNISEIQESFGKDIATLIDRYRKEGHIDSFDLMTDAYTLQKNQIQDLIKSIVI